MNARYQQRHCVEVFIVRNRQGRKDIVIPALDQAGVTERYGFPAGDRTIEFQLHANESSKGSGPGLFFGIP